MATAEDLVRQRRSARLFLATGTATLLVGIVLLTGIDAADGVARTLAIIGAVAALLGSASNFLLAVLAHQGRLRR